MEKLTPGQGSEQANFETPQLKNPTESQEVSGEKTKDIEKKLKNILGNETFYVTDQGIIMTEKQYKEELRKAEQKGETLKQHFH